MATQDRIFQGKLDILSLRAITGQIEQAVVIFVEDQFAKTWLEALLRQAGDIPMEHVQIHAMHGDGAAVSMNRYHNKNPAIQIPSVCFIDGDSKQEESEEEHVYRLPGQSPEGYIFDAVLEKWDEIGGKLSVALYEKYENHEKVKNKCELIRQQTMDPHLLYTKLGEKLALIPEKTVSAAFANFWAQSNPETLNSLIEPVRKILRIAEHKKSPRAT